MLDFEPADEAGADVRRRSPSASATVRSPGCASMDADELYELYRTHPELGRYFYPVVDGVVLPDDADDRVRRARSRRRSRS